MANDLIVVTLKKVTNLVVSLIMLQRNYFESILICLIFGQSMVTSCY